MTWANVIAFSQFYIFTSVCRVSQSSSGYARRKHKKPWQQRSGENNHYLNWGSTQRSASQKSSHDPCESCRPKSSGGWCDRTSWDTCTMSSGLQSAQEMSQNRHTVHQSLGCKWVPYTFKRLAVAWHFLPFILAIPGLKQPSCFPLVHGAESIAGGGSQRGRIQALSRLSLGTVLMLDLTTNAAEALATSWHKPDWPCRRTPSRSPKIRHHVQAWQEPLQGRGRWYVQRRLAWR